MIPDPPCQSYVVFLVAYVVESVQQAACWWSLFTDCVRLSCQDQKNCGVTWGEHFLGWGFLLARLLEEVWYCTIVPMWVLHADTM